MSSTDIPKVIPAQLSFLAIYNPSLSSSDDDVHKQIVFYHSKASKSKPKAQSRSSRFKQESDTNNEELNEQLLQVGLAQGMVGFARSFSNGEAVESIDTDTTRIILIELEAGFWILASIDLTRLPAAASSSKSGPTGSNSSAPAYEYSSREVSPPDLLKQQLRSAYSTFCLHHTNFQRLFAKKGREPFERVLHKYWALFARRWDVLLHGSPAVDIFGGLKLASGGELGMGVGEEEWGSPERDVLEGYIRNTEGLVDVLVSRFGEPAPPTVDTKTKAQKAAHDPSDLEPWLGSGSCPGPADGVVFSGTGVLSRQSLRDITRWVETIYTHGEHAYGVSINPTSGRDRTKRKAPRSKQVAAPSPDSEPAKIAPPPSIPPPIVRAAEASLDNASKAVETAGRTPAKEDESLPSLGDVDAWKKYLTIPYSNLFGGKKAQTEPADDAASAAADIDDDQKNPVVEALTQKQKENDGYFLVGLQGDMDDEDDDSPRIQLRALQVELAKDVPITPEAGSDTPGHEKELDFSTTRKLSRLRILVYVHRPFIYTFFFSHGTQSLAFAAHYRNLHSFFSPLNISLIKSTSPEKIAERISGASDPHTTNSEPNALPIYDVVYDPRTFTVHSSLPNIPEPGTLTSEGLTNGAAGWTRVEALHVHSHILSAVSDTRRDFGKIEQTCKTSRGWWVAWMRLPPSGLIDKPTEEDEGTSVEFNSDDLREAFLVRRARDAVAPTAKSSGRFSSGMWGLGGPSTEEKMGGAAAGWGPRGLAEGIGVDARRYVEEILSLCR